MPGSFVNTGDLGQHMFAQFGQVLRCLLLPGFSCGAANVLIRLRGCVRLSNTLFSYFYYGARVNISRYFSFKVFDLANRFSSTCIPPKIMKRIIP